MNEELKTRLVKYLDAMEEAGSRGVEFVATNAPETVRQFVQWEIFGNLMAGSFLVAGALLLVATIALIWKVSKGFTTDDRQFTRALSSIACGLLIALALGLSCQFWYGAAKAYFAPNVFLIEKAAQLLKGVR